MKLNERELILYVGFPIGIITLFFYGGLDHLSYYSEEICVESHAEKREGTSYNGYVFYKTERNVSICDKYEPNPLYDGNLGDWRKANFQWN
jgi:hypothetical protein